MFNYKTVFFALGIILIVLGVSMLVPVFIQIYFDDFDSTFIISSLITVIFGVLFFLSNIDHNHKINTQQAFLLTALSWVGVAIFGSIPFFFLICSFLLPTLFLRACLELQQLGQQLLQILKSLQKPF